jgi:RNA polymerase sigma factor (sigma-70 family)
MPPRWPRRLLEVHRILQSSSGEGPRRAAFEEAWLLIHSALGRYLDLHAARMGSADREDVEDLASEKALELVRRLESGAWNPEGRDPGEVAGFLSTVARNGLVDLFRERGRHVEHEEHDEREIQPAAGSASVSETPAIRLERRTFARALRACASQLSARDRTVWLFRVFYDLRSREIARHPEVRLKPSHVDVILQRCRSTVRDCMSRKGHQPGELPPGTFAELWDAFRMPPSPRMPPPAGRGEIR